MISINQTFDAPTSPAEFGFPTGAAISDGVLALTQGMGNYTTSVKQFDPSVQEERTLDLRFDWKTAIAGSAMKTGLELRDSTGHLVFAVAATSSELRYAVTGPVSAPSSAPDSLDPMWITTGYDRSKWYMVDLHLDFVLGKVQYSITSREAAPVTPASGTANTTAGNLANFVACNYYGTGPQSIDNFRLIRPGYSPYGSLVGATAYAFGDSIVYGHKYPRGFADFVAEREGIVLTKYARNGATIGPAADASGGQIINQVKSASAQAPDFVLFDGGTNDTQKIHDEHAYPVGTVTGSHNPRSFDTGTYAGALEQTVYTMKHKWPSARLVYVAVHKLGSRDWATQLALRDVTLLAAAKWGVAVADVFAKTTLDTRDDAQRVRYTFDNLVNGFPGSNGSGTHPNVSGITDFYVPVLTAELKALQSR